MSLFDAGWSSALTRDRFPLLMCHADYSALPFTFNNLAGTYLWLAVVIDLAISTTLYAQLRSHSRIGDSLNAGLMRSLGQIALRTAIPTTVMATVGAVMSTAFPVDELRTLNAVFAIYCEHSSFARSIAIADPRLNTRSTVVSLRLFLAVHPLFSGSFEHASALLGPSLHRLGQRVTSGPSGY